MPEVIPAYCSSRTQEDDTEVHPPQGILARLLPGRGLAAIHDYAQWIRILPGIESMGFDEAGWTAAVATWYRDSFLDGGPVKYAHIARKFDDQAGSSCEQFSQGGHYPATCGAKMPWCSERKCRRHHCSAIRSQFVQQDATDNHARLRQRWSKSHTKVAEELSGTQAMVKVRECSV